MNALVREEPAPVKAMVEAPVARQCAALPWRIGRKGRFEVLLVTSRRGGHWILPKGWQMPGRSAAQSAAREAFERAGAIGRPGSEPLGSYSHSSLMEDGSIELREVAVHGLQVQGTLVDWPQKGQRKRLWRSVDEAIRLVGDPGLAELLRTLKPDGINLIQANGPGAAQSVPHLHIHILPRHTNDGLAINWHPKPGDMAKIKQVYERIMAQMK